MTVEVCKDLFGNELHVGDLVAFNTPQYRGLTIGQIKEFTPKKVRISYGDGYGSKEFLTELNWVVKRK